jgi:uncharacterized protein YjbJ (UPF0337 family)
MDGSASRLFAQCTRSSVAHVIAFNTRWKDRRQAAFRIHLAICYLSNRFDLSPDYQAKPFSSPHGLPEAPGIVSPSQWPDHIFSADTFNQFHSQEHTMNKDQTKGRIEEAKGKVKEVAGNLVGNDNLALKGTIQKSGGKAQAAFGDLKKDIKDASKGK